MSTAAPKTRGSTGAARNDRRFAPARDVRAAEAGNEIVLLHLERGTYYTLNGTGAWIWQRLGAGATVAELCAGIVDRFEIDEPEARRDLIELFEELESEGLIEAPAERPPSDGAAP